MRATLGDDKPPEISNWDDFISWLQTQPILKPEELLALLRPDHKPVWNSHRQVASLLKISREHLLWLARNGLPAWVVQPGGSRPRATPEYLQEQGLKDVIFDLREVLDFARQHPDWCSRHGRRTLLLSTPDWMDPQKLLERWHKRLLWLESKVRGMMLPVYSIDYLDQNGEPRPLSEDELAKRTGALLDGCLFRLADVQTFERGQKKLLKLHDQAITRLHARDKVYQLLPDNPDLTKPEAAKILHAHHEFGHVTEKTLKTYFADLPLKNGRKGRPQKTNKSRK